MKTWFLSSLKWQIALSCLTLLLISENTHAQSAANTQQGLNLFYYSFAAAILILVVASVFIIQKARRILSEHGQPMFQHDSTFFKKMTNAKTTVAVVMIALVLIGMYLVINYKPS